MSKTSTHPTDEQLEAFGLGRLAPESAVRIESHIAHCDSCCAKLHGARNDTLIGLAKAAYKDVETASTLSEKQTGGELSENTVPVELRDHPQYSLISILGRGGMGTVYKARHKMMHRVVALKVIGSNFISHPTAVKRFEREVRAAAQLDHPNIVRAFDAGRAGDLHFLVMEHVEGVSLASYVESKGPLLVNPACHLIRQAALGLQHAHDKGMVHRDIKPHNLMLTTKSQVKILDFGLARLADERRATTLHTMAEQINDDLKTSSLTKVGTIVGTPDYLAPEQAQCSRSADIRSDIYSLGCTLYFLLTGLPPFPRGSALEKLFQHCEDQPPPPPRIPDEVQAILDRMMAKRAEDRYQTPAELVSDLAPFAKKGFAELKEGTTSEEIPTPVPVKRRGAATREVKAPRPRNDTLPGFEKEKDLAPTQNLQAPTKPKPGPKNRKMPMILAAALAAIVIPLAVILISSSGEDDKPGPIAKNPKKDDSSKIKDGKLVSFKDDGRNGFGTEVPSPKQALFILPRQNLWAEDFFPVYDALKKTKNITVVTASTEWYAHTAPGSSKQYPHKLKVDMILHKKMKTKDYDAVIFVGYKNEEYINDGEPRDIVFRFVQEMFWGKEKKLVAAICAGQEVLGHLGFLNNRTVAYHTERGKDWFPPEKRKYIKLDKKSPVRQDGNLITARGPEDHAEFSKALIDALSRIQ